MSGAVDVISALASGRKASQLYPPTHPAFAEAIDTLMTALHEATLGGPFQVNLHKGRLYHQSVVIPDDSPAVLAMQEAFESRRIDSMTLHPALTRDEAIALVEVLSLRPSPSLDVEAELTSRGVTGITIALLADEDEEERAERERRREQDRAMYNRLVSILRTMSASISQKGAADLGQAGDVVGSVLHRLLEDQSAVLALATIKGQSETTLFHSINVMIYSLTLGTALGLPEEGLTSLGISALMHDVGKAVFDPSDPQQAQSMLFMHPMVGADILSRLPGEDKAPMLVAYEHHMRVDGGGYPEHPADYIAHPYSRMVSIANRYATLVDPGPHAEPLTPDRAIMQILSEAGTALDPLFTRLFVKAMGVFPVGCMVRLSDMSAGVVSKTREASLTPTVRVLYDPAGMQVENPEEIDLSDSGCTLTIVEVVDPASLAVSVSDHL